MEGGGYFRGTSKEQDSRFSDKEKKLMKTMKFPSEYNTKIDMKQIKLEVIKPWIGQKLTELLGFEDEVLLGYVFSLLEENQFPDPRQLQINITGFLEKDASGFVLDMWKLLISAQNNHGIPPEFLEKKKDEIRRRKAEYDRIQSELAKKRELQERIKSIPNYGDTAAKRFAEDEALSRQAQRQQEFNESIVLQTLDGRAPIDRMDRTRFRTTRRDSHDKESDEKYRKRSKRSRSRSSSPPEQRRRHRSRSRDKDRNREKRKRSSSPSPSIKVKESKWDKLI